MLWILMFDLFSVVQGNFICSGQCLTMVHSCGDIVLLPCSFSWKGPPPSSSYELVWQVRQRGNDYVVHDDDMQTPANQQQNSMFTNRTSVSEGWSRHGNATLQIMDVSESDNGLYTCDLLTTRPFARKICTEVQLIVNTDSLSCGTNKSLTIASGNPVQLPCLRRPTCLQHNRREIHWRFKASNSETEQELPGQPSAEDGRIAVHANGTLVLQKVSSSDSGNYLCYLKGTEMCSGFSLNVVDVAIEDLGPQPTLDTLGIYVGVGGFLFVIIVVIGWFSSRFRDSKQSQQEHCTESSKKDAETPNISEPPREEAQINISDEDNPDHSTVDSMEGLLKNEKT
ncbi:hypothetical protein NDU88_004695 [Pleurodeles waltl]|uniref:Ig-like domain-containing protein n=1 Tax=Pleurodeles waltl TaxID=8319 RepID=A0AAV7L063_PLEWA|nr:hypothetical protein NDU88_004695 [Pleurodeles waltl]